MAVKKDFLVEIHTEELPPKALSRLAKSFLTEIETRLVKAQLEFKEAEFFATPRRLTVLVKGLSEQQPDTTSERRGPSVEAAFDSAGTPTPACVGFARSCGVTPDQLIRIQTPQGEWMGLTQTISGKHVSELMPAIVTESLNALPIPKRMRWGSGTVEFVRPVHSVIMLYGDDVIDAEILGVRTGRETRGHRFHSKKILSIPKPSAYLKRLESQGHVIADFERRKEMIKEQAEAIVHKAFGEKAQIVISDALLDEVTGLVEWPVAILGDFDQRFLDVPPEALISAMQDHQRYFAVLDQNNKLMPHFVTISNIDSRDMQSVIAGNERVLRARLSDAAFFYETDKKRKLEERLESLKNVVFQAKLGTLYEKAQRLSELTAHIATQMGENESAAKRAGLLAKADLATEMVGEFPELQGIAGYYYAKNDGEPDAVAQAIREQYLPRFSGDVLPATTLGAALALAERLDILVGVFGINQAPTGDKDPFSLRRAALGILRILIEHKLNLDLEELLNFSLKTYAEKFSHPEGIQPVLNFILERLKPWYQEQNINPDVFAAVFALGITRPYDFHLRIQAVQSFKQLPEAAALSAAYKRINNILEKNTADAHTSHDPQKIDNQLLEAQAEIALAEAMEKMHEVINALYLQSQYGQVLMHLAGLRKVVDDFFDQVMVMTDNKPVRDNRLLLLAQLRASFFQVADIAMLQTS
jgi:glycyl-tRNA synthetase beta chain